MTRSHIQIQKSFTSDSKGIEQETPKTFTHFKVKQQMHTILDVEGFDAPKIWSQTDLESKRLNKEGIRLPLALIYSKADKLSIRA